MRMCRTCGLLCLVSIWMICAAAQAQSPTNIRLRLLDGKNGRIILGAGVLLWVNHNATPRGEWVKANEDGTTQIVTPPGVVDLLVHSTYDDATEYYVNCDSPKAMDTPQEMWYKVSDIMSSGVIATDGCIKEKDFEKLKISVKPGELVLFVRKESWKDRAHQMAQ